jgi:HlyD family secretion protein
MTASMKRLVLWSVPAAVLVVVLAVLFRPRAELVDVVQVQMAPMLVTIDEEGETRTRDVYTINAPVGGRLLRTTLREGDPVIANQTPVAQIEPSEPEFLDPRSQAQSEAARDAATAALALAAAELKQAEAERDFATAEVQRFRELYEKGTIPEQQVDDAERAAQSTLAAVEAAQASLAVRQFELNRAEASLITPAGAHESHGSWCECVTVRSPVNGRVLRVHHKSETIVSPGTPLIEVGDPHDLEIVADYLSIDAVKVKAGQAAFIEGWGQDIRLNAVVQRVEPYAFMKVSALGIEEQRVNVVLDITDPAENWAALGHGYRVESRIIDWQTDAVKTVPLTALFRQGDDWAVFVDENDTAVLRNVKIGHTAGLAVEILDGLEIGEWVVMHPNDRLEDGSRLRRRD